MQEPIRRRQKHGSRYDEMLRAAVRIIALKGIEAASMRKIAKEAGCTIGLITHYFKDKNALIEHLYELILTMTYDNIKEHIALSGTHTGIMKLATISYAMALPADSSLGDTSRFWLGINSVAINNMRLKKIRSRIYRKARNLLLSAANEALDAGQLHNDVKAENLADILAPLVDGMWDASHFSSSTYFVKHRCDLIYDLLWRYSTEKGRKDLIKHHEM